ncbi:MAG: hypothetical protein WC934_02015 [Acidithiobacillus sp.]|uniref:hypothetical protein n=1 Tax=Acidithiobacillus sp. TaxID=1872118 RepID=UPI00355DA4F7
MNDKKSIKTWKDLFCKKDEKCTPDIVFERIILYQDPEIKENIDEITQYLKSNNLQVDESFSNVIDIHGKSSNIHSTLTKLNEKQGYKGNLDKCMANKNQKIIVHGNENTCQGIITDIDDFASKLNLQKVPKSLEYTDGKKTFSTHKLAQKIDQEYNKFGKKYQTVQNFKYQKKELIDRLKDNFNQSVKDREENKSYIPKDIQNIKGEYDFDDEYRIVITDDPVEIALKSTGRPWEKTSCERISGCHWDGFIDDIKYNNFIAFVIDKKGIPIGRTMLRWGEDKKDGFSCIGQEPSMYEKGIRSSIIDEIHNKIDDIISDKNLESEQCETPYKYGGYSDQMEKSDVNIVYSNRNDLKVPKDNQWLIYSSSNENEIDIVNGNNISRSERRKLLEYGYEWKDNEEAVEEYFRGTYADEWTRNISSLYDIKERLVEKFDDIVEDLPHEVPQKLNKNTQTQFDYLKRRFGHEMDNEDEIFWKKFLHKHDEEYSDNIFYDLGENDTVYHDLNNGTYFSIHDSDIQSNTLDALRDQGSWRLEQDELYQD